MAIEPISNQEIDAIEKLLIGSGIFDDERRHFIRCIDSSLDLVACPGSGKTTSLIAKLVLLSNRTPFEDGRGICVLTHTNVAINEIKEKLGAKSEILFKYPNYFGTIQSFVNKYLAIPCWSTTYGNRNIICDEITYYRKIEQKKNCFPLLKGFQKQDYRNINYFNMNNENFIYSYRFDLIEGEIVLLKKMGGIIEEFKAPKKRKTDFTPEEKNKIREWFTKFKASIHKNDSVFCYDDMYFLSKFYLKKNPQVIQEFSKRFAFTFIDEMQDTTSWQMQILETLFANKPDVIFQRIGDPNQEIFDIDSTTVWRPDLTAKDSVKQLNKSLRFGNEIADRIKFICVSDVSKTLCGINPNSHIPQIILYKDETIGKVLEKFCEIIHAKNLTKKTKPLFKAIAWRGKNDGSGKLCLNHYYRDYQKASIKKRLIYNNLLSYLIVQEKTTDTYNQLINTFVQLLEIAEIRTTTNSRYTKTSMLLSIEKMGETIYANFLTKLSLWIFELHATASYNLKVLQEIKEFIISDFVNYFYIDINLIKNFISDKSIEIPINDSISNDEYLSIKYPEIKIKIDTIHAVKGETHTATLLLETSYEGKTESQRLINQLKGQSYIMPKKGGIEMQKTLKMAHVAMSRPTDLLCFAVNIKNLDGHLDEIVLGDKNPNGWLINDDLLI